MSTLAEKKSTTVEQTKQTQTIHTKPPKEVVVIVYPKKYYDYKVLTLYFNNKKDCSKDDFAAKKYKVKATVPLNYVKDLQKDLISLGYLPTGQDDGWYGGSTRRAVLRFQRHAKRTYRMIGGKGGAVDDAFDGTGPLSEGKEPVFSDNENGVCDHGTASEIKL